MKFIDGGLVTNQLQITTQEIGLYGDGTMKASKFGNSLERRLGDPINQETGDSL